jgi:hypothetical protein
MASSPLDPRAAQAFRRRRLDFPDVGQERTQSPDQRRIVLFHAEPVQRVQGEMATELVRRQLRVEHPVRAVRGARTVQRDVAFPRFRQQDLGRLEPGQLRLQSVVGNPRAGELTGADVGGGQRHLGIRLDHGDQPVVSPLVQERVRGDGPGRDGLDHLSADDVPGLCRVLHLLADGHPASHSNQALQVLVPGFDGDPGQGHVGGAAVVAGRESQAQEPGPFLGVLVEHLVEITDAEEDDRVRMARLGVAPLAHQGCVVLLRHPARGGPAKSHLASLRIAGRWGRGQPP